MIAVKKTDIHIALVMATALIFTNPIPAFGFSRCGSLGDSCPYAPGGNAGHGKHFSLHNTRSKFEKCSTIMGYAVSLKQLDPIHRKHVTNERATFELAVVATWLAEGFDRATARKTTVRAVRMWRPVIERIYTQRGMHLVAVDLRQCRKLKPARTWWVRKLSTFP